MCVRSLISVSKQVDTGVSSRKLGNSPQDGPQRWLVRGQPHVGHDVLEVDVADDVLCIACTLGDRESGVHIQVGGDQAIGN